jgi:hypothetical protein
MVKLAHEQFDLLLRALTFGYVGHKRNDAGGLARGVSQQRDPLVRLHHPAILIEIPARYFERRDLLCDQALCLVEIHIAIVGMLQIRDAELPKDIPNNNRYEFGISLGLIV